MNRVNVPQLRFPVFEGEWKNIKLDKIVNKVGSGNTPSGGDQVYQNSGIPFIRSQNVLENALRIDQTHISLEINDRMKGSIVEANDILLNITGGSIGRSCVVPADFVIGNVNQHVCIIRLKENYSPRFLQPFLFSHKGQKLIYQGQTGSGREGINFQSIRLFKIVIPTFPEQQKIASFLSAVDEKIQQLSRKKELLEQYKKGVMQQLFSGKLRFKDENGNDYADWIDFKIGDLDFYISDGNYGELYPKASEMKLSGIPFIRANNIKNLKLTWKDMKYIEPQHHKILDSGHLKTGDILVTTRGDIGMLAYVEEDFDNANINAQICLIRSPDNLISKYILQFLASDFGLKQFKSLQTGTALKQLPKGNLNKVIIPVPSYEEQQKIANFLSNIDAKIENVNQQINQTQIFKKGLLQQMFV
jgi:type I restriction enzyme S subunit